MTILSGVMLLWFILTALSVLYVAIDIRTTPEDPVMKWGFVIITAFIGPLGAFLYVLGCREPLPGTHEAYVSAKWRQVLGSTMHCVAGDGVGIVAAAVITAQWHWPLAADLVVEYLAGFAFGWTIFQSLFMKSMAGGSYRQALKSSFLPELFSMNGVMAGMTVVMVTAMSHLAKAHSPASPEFWFIMSMSLLAGFLVAYPINWWLVSLGLKHGMMTVRPEGYTPPLISGLFLAGQALSAGHRAPTAHLSSHEGHHPPAHGSGSHDHAHGEHPAPTVSPKTLWQLGAVSFAVLAAGIGFADLMGNLGLQ